MHAEVTAYKGRIIVELKVKESIPGEVTTSLDTPRFAGQVIRNTAKNLGISKEAFELLKSVRRGEELTGDVDWSHTEDGSTVFGWKGGRCAIFTPANCQGSRKFTVGGFVVIPNHVPDGARKQLDRYVDAHPTKLGLLTNESL
jgi:hypothetical protein